MASNRPPEAVSLKKRNMYLDLDKNRIYEERVTTYAEILAEKYPDYFDFDLHCVILRMMVSSELEYEYCSRKIENDIDWSMMDVKRRDKAFDRLKWCWDKLGFPLEVMKRMKLAMKSGVDTNLSMEEEMTNLMKTMDVDSMV